MRWGKSCGIFRGEGASESPRFARGLFFVAVTNTDRIGSATVRSRFAVRAGLVHVAHAAAVTAGGSCLLGLGDLRDHGFGRQHEAGDGGCIQ